MLRVSRRQVFRLLPLLAALVAVGVGTYFVGLSAINGMQRSQADFGARSFGKYLVQQVPNLTTILDDGKSDAEASAALGTIKPIGSVFKFRLFDRMGNLRVDSSPFAAAHIVDSRNAFEDIDARVVATSGRPSFSLNKGDGSFLPAYYSEMLVPLLDGNQAIGVLSVLSDETGTRPELFGQFQALILQVLALVVVAFGIPVALYLRKQEQLEATRRHLDHSAHHDELTGVLNRIGFYSALSQQIQSSPAKDGEGSVGVHIIDLDRFKDVNELSGHAVGDEVLKQATQRLVRLIGNHRHLARLGADEFAVVQPFKSDEPQPMTELGDEIARVLAQPFLVGDQLLQIGASIGHADYPSDAHGVADLMRAADVALHHAKLHRRGGAVAFLPSMDVERQNHHRIDVRVRQALANNEFDLHFQPVVELESGKLRGFEALLRLNDDEGKPISPADFIPVAEENGLIGEIGIWVLREACRVARQWPDELFVAVNLSPAQFSQAGMAQRVRDALDWSGLKARRLELEVTESLLITESDKVRRELTAIKALGASLALDDFGTGYSSLSYLWRFPFDKLKVDRSFMVDLTEPGAKSREVLSTIIALGRVLNLRITAEGVETEAQAAVLRELDCDLVQGYLTGRPQPVTAVAATILNAFGSTRRPRTPGSKQASQA